MSKNNRIVVEEAGNPVNVHLSLFSGIAMIVGSIIGSGIFVTAGPSLSATGSVGMSLIVWTAAGLISALGGLCYVELGCMMPKNGGEHNYLLASFGPYVAYAFDWTQSLLSFPLGVSAMAVVSAEYLIKLAMISTDNPSPAPTSDLLLKGVACALIITITCLNCISAKIGARISDVLTLIKVAALIFIVGIGFVYLAKGSVGNFKNSFVGSSVNPVDYGKALYFQLFTYGGWNNLNLMVGELKKPEKNLPLAIIISMSLVIIVYLLTNVAYFAVLPLELMGDEDINIGLEFGSRVFGFAGAIIIPVLVVLSTIGSTNASLYGTSRLVAATAEQGLLYPKFLGTYNRLTHTPVSALILTAILSCLYVIPANFDILMGVCGFTVWIFFFLTILGLLKLRYSAPDMPRPFKVYLFVPILFLLIAVFLIIFPFAFVTDLEKTLPYVASIVIMLVPIAIVYVRLNGIKGRFIHSPLLYK